MHNKIFACIDGGPQTEGVCDYGIWAAQCLGAPLTFLHALDRHPERAAVTDYSGNILPSEQESLLTKLVDLDEQRSKLAQEHGRQLLHAARIRAEAKGLESVDTLQRHGALLETAVDVQSGARLYILGQHLQKEETSKSYFDQNAEKIVRGIKRPVLVTTGGFKPPGQFLIAFDSSVTGRKMVQTVAASPLLKGLTCHIVMVGDATTKHEHDLGWAREVMAEAGFMVQTDLRQGDPNTVLQEEIAARRVDMLVMGAYGHSRIRELIMGSTTTTLLRTSPVPVLIIR
ncbi:MAG: universal stress protein [Pusillimonas sp.]|nr:universal stress protein [Pusillimonas sp.]